MAKALSRPALASGAECRTSLLLLGFTYDKKLLEEDKKDILQVVRAGEPPEQIHRDGARIQALESSAYACYAISKNCPGSSVEGRHICGDFSEKGIVKTIKETYKGVSFREMGSPRSRVREMGSPRSSLA